MCGQKDKNGTEVYEGDILEFVETDYLTNETKKSYKLVKSTTDGWKLQDLSNPNSMWSVRYCKRYTVAGNIYENPELIKRDRSVEECVKTLIKNTFEEHDPELAKDIIAHTMLFYEKSIRDLKKKLREE